MTRESAKLQSWAFIDERGRILADTTFESADDAWRIALGWPTISEIDEAKARGCRVARVTISEVCDDAG